MAVKENRRVRITRRIFQDALVELMEEQPLEKITVTDVCQRADMNRSTFYSHYRDVSQLLYEMETEVIDQLPMKSEDSENLTSEEYLRQLEAFFRYIQENARLFHTLIVQSEGSGFYHRLVNEVLRVTVGGFEETSLQNQYACSYCVNGVVGILKDWIGSDFPISAGDFARIVACMTYNSLRTDGWETAPEPAEK